MPNLQRPLRSVVRVCVGLLVAARLVTAGDAVDESQQRLLRDIKYLSSDDLEGRGVGLKGLDLAADYIKAEFAKAGLKVDALNGDAYQPFEMTVGATLGSPNSLTLHGPEGKTIELKLNETFSPQSFGGSGAIDGPIVFVGYGIDAADKDYNDFAGIDLQGKVALIMRREPQQGNPQGKFAGAHGGVSQYAALTSKVSNAFGKGAAAIILVDDPYSAREAVENLKKQISKHAESVADAAQAFDAVPATEPMKVEETRKTLHDLVERYQGLKADLAAGEKDPLMKFGYGGHESTRSIPIVHITRKTADELLQASLKKSLKDLETEIDKDVKPQSAPLEGWKAVGQVSIDRQKAQVKNVVAVLEGSGPKANETIVVGAHYDHVGRGGNGSLAPGSKEIHNGADDNASGSVTLLEVARRLAARPEKLPRRVVFVAFTAEELGLIGSAEYVKTPPFPLEQTIAMFNMDMVGRLTDNKLTIFGTKTAPQWNPLLEKYGKEFGFELTYKPEGFGPSDHSSFYAKKIPVLHFFTGNHADYHRPGDDWEKINVPGMEKIGEMVEKLVVDTALAEGRPEYVAVQATGQPQRGGNRPYFGSIPDFGVDKPGYALQGVAPGSPAEKGGLKGGDRIVKIADNKIDNLDDFDLALRKFMPGDTVEITVVRGEAEVKLKVTLDKPR